MNTTSSTSDAPALSTFLAEPLSVGEPDIAGNLAVFPLFGPDATVDYLSFAQGRALGASVGELESGASVNDLMVENPTDKGLLLFEGEEVLGAQQNRTFDVTILVGAGAKLRVPVSCMEAGRWDGSRSSERFAPSPQAAVPSMRRMKAMHARQRVAAGVEARADQSEVWNQIDQTSARLGAHSPTRAMHDVFESQRDRLAQAAANVKLRPGQVGAIAAIGSELAVLDYVSRPEVFAALHGPLVQGYALDALDLQQDGETETPDIGTARGFTLLATDAPIADRRPGTGLGQEIRFEANGLAGSGLAHEDELVQLSVHPADAGEDDLVIRATPVTASIRRPSRRRHRPQG